MSWRSGDYTSGTIRGRGYRTQYVEFGARPSDLPEGSRGWPDVKFENHNRCVHPVSASRYLSQDFSAQHKREQRNHFAMGQTTSLTKVERKPSTPVEGWLPYLLDFLDAHCVGAVRPGFLPEPTEAFRR